MGKRVHGRGGGLVDGPCKHLRLDRFSGLSDALNVRTVTVIEENMEEHCDQCQVRLLPDPKTPQAQVARDQPSTPSPKPALCPQTDLTLTLGCSLDLNPSYL